MPSSDNCGSGEAPSFKVGDRVKWTAMLRSQPEGVVIRIHDGSDPDDESDCDCFRSGHTVRVRWDDGSTGSAQPSAMTVLRSEAAKSGMITDAHLRTMGILPDEDSLLSAEDSETVLQALERGEPPPERFFAGGAYQKEDREAHEKVMRHLASKCTAAVEFDENCPTCGVHQIHHPRTVLAEAQSCPMCDGTGSRVATEDPARSVYTCRTCKGSGRRSAAAARLDADGTAQPLTEIVAVMPPCDDPTDVGRTVHAGQATHYVARPTQRQVRADAPSIPRVTLYEDNDRESHVCAHGRDFRSSGCLHCGWPGPEGDDMLKARINHALSAEMAANPGTAEAPADAYSHTAGNVDLYEKCRGFVAQANARRRGLTAGTQDLYDFVSGLRRNEAMPDEAAFRAGYKAAMMCGVSPLAVTVASAWDAWRNGRERASLRPGSAGSFVDDASQPRNSRPHVPAREGEETGATSDCPNASRSLRDRSVTPEMIAEAIRTPEPADRPSEACNCGAPRGADHGILCPVRRADEQEEADEFRDVAVAAAAAWEQIDNNLAGKKVRDLRDALLASGLIAEAEFTSASGCDK